MAKESAPGSPLRVLYSFPHQLGAPGIGTTALNQVRGLVDRGLEVSVWCTSVAASRPKLPDEVVETLVFAGQRVPHRAIGIDRAIRLHDRRVARGLRRAGRSYDIVHGWPLGSRTTLATARSLGVVGLRESPNSYTAVAYERVAAEAQRLGLTIAKGASHHFDPARLAREEQEYDLASAVLAPSDAVMDSYRLRGGPPLDVRRHRYGFDPGRFPCPPRGNRSGSPFVLAFVGSCEPRKGLHHALSAWRSQDLASEGSRFMIVGRWDEAYRNLLSSELEAPGVELHDVSDDVGAIMQRADALILPSLEEGSALVTYEAQASGCALLVSDATGALMTDGVQGFIHRAGDVDALSDQLGKLARDPDLLARMQESAIEHRDELTWDAAAARLEKVYREVLAEA